MKSRLQAEEQLTSYHLTRIVHHAYSEPVDEYNNPMGCHCLGLEKINGKWRLCHGYEHYTAPDASGNGNRLLIAR